MDQITIQGYVFNVPRPYEAGHVCTQAEAEVLNQKLHENLRCNFGKQIEVHGSGGAAPHTLQQLFDEYRITYSFGGPDPSIAEARLIALGIVKTRLRSEGKAIGDYTKAELHKEASRLLEGPQAGEIRMMAKERVEKVRLAAKRELERMKKEQA